MSASYKIRYKDNTGENVTDFLCKAEANRLFRKKHNEKVLITEWCDMEYWGDLEKESETGVEEDVSVVHRFTRRIDTILGKKIVTPFFVENW